jgi:hypothetical protein
VTNRNEESGEPVRKKGGEKQSWNLPKDTFTLQEIREARDRDDLQR